MNENDEKDAKNLQDNNPRMIQQTILDLYVKFKVILLETSNKSYRKYFPSREAKKFGSKIKEINQILQSLGDGSEKFSQLQGFVSSLDTTAKYLHNQDGISAFAFFLDLFINMTTELFVSKQEIVELMNENRSLIEKVKELESTLSEMENEISLKEMSISEDNIFSESNDRKGVLQLVSDSILFANHSSVTILETFVAMNDFDGQEKLVVLYEDLQSQQFPLSDFVVWKDVNSLAANSDSHDLEAWTEYCTSQPKQFMQLLKDFYDPNCLDLIGTSRDIVAISPTAWSINGSSPFEPALIVYKKCLGLSHIDNKHSLTNSLTLTDGRQMKIIVKENYFSNAMHQNGIGVVGFDNEYGTIGGIASDTSNNSYMITCEHVVVEAQNLIKKKGKLASKNIKFMIPSQGPRKASVIAATNSFDPDLKLNGNFLNALLTKCETDEFKQIFQPPGAGAGDVTVKEVADYLANNQVELSVNPKDIKTFETTITKEIDTKVDKVGKIKVSFTGDVAAIPLNSAGVSFDQSCDINGTFGLQDLFGHWANGNSHLFVKKKGVNDSSVQTGSIAKPMHVQTPMDKSLFMSNDYRSSTLVDPLKGHGRVLLGQLLVTGNGFGRGGDSGSSVYVENGDLDKLIVGTFVGSFKDGVRYVVSPAEVIEEDKKLQWMKILL
jgi:hypothetical protein